jgi:hypothetical protein|tara:strand:- start:1276 stop:1512 length:237 start_codon:yes stop_codon:yes gene_type:complete
MNHLYNAILSHYKSKESEALAVLDMYFNNSIGVPSHSNILEELETWTEKLTSARDNIKTLEELVKFTDLPDYGEQEDE